MKIPACLKVLFLLVHLLLTLMLVLLIVMLLLQLNSIVLTGILYL